jgi:hypothetical protein
MIPRWIAQLMAQERCRTYGLPKTRPSSCTSQSRCSVAWRCSCGYECVVKQALVCPKCGKRQRQPNAEGESRAASARTLHPLVGSLNQEV